jgi:hypothetical protein
VAWPLVLELPLVLDLPLVPCERPPPLLRG